MYDVPDVIATLNDVVSEFGSDYQYPNADSETCKYVKEGKPRCLVAQVAYRLGVPVTELEGWDNCVFSNIGNVGGLIFTSEALELLGYVQERQDQGTPWGDAVTDALNPMND